MGTILNCARAGETACATPAVSCVGQAARGRSLSSAPQEMVVLSPDAGETACATKAVV
jgi:hypothetical protein